jgi:hypothetical protein
LTLWQVQASSTAIKIQIFRQIACLGILSSKHTSGMELPTSQIKANPFTISDEMFSKIENALERFS